MALPIRLLLINSQVKFSANLKKALERAGGFEVAAFTSVETALEYARNRALDAVMVDFELRDGTAPDVIERLRGLQTDVAVIISPNTPETEAIGRHLGVQAVVDIPISARMLMPIVQRAVAQALDNMPDTVLGDNPQRGPGSLVTPQVPLPPRPVEPAAAPPPAIKPLPSKQAAQPPKPQPAAPPKPAPPAKPAQPAASVKPATLPGAGDMPRTGLLKRLSEEAAPTLEQGGTVRDLAASLGDTSSQVLEIRKDRPPTLTPEPEAPPEIEPLPNVAKALLQGSTGALKAVAEKSAERERETRRADQEALSESSLMTPARDVPEQAVLAVQLTQAALNLTAEATVLADRQGIVAAAGNLPTEDIEDLRRAVGADWNATGTQSRIRFVTLPSSGKDYMLFSRKTVGDYTLTMIFAGNTPLRDIRRQSSMVIEALNAPPAPPEPAPAPPAPPDAKPPPSAAASSSVPGRVRSPQTFIWLVNPRLRPLDQGTAQAVLEALNSRLTRDSWRVHALDVYGKYIYLFADVPGDDLPAVTIAHLKTISGEIVQARSPQITADALWLDAYLVLMPGRDLSKEEVQRFVKFAGS